MARSVASYAISVVAYTSAFHKKMRGVRRAMRRLSKRIRSVASSLSALTGGFSVVAIVAAFGKAAMAGERFNQAMRSSLAIMGDVSAAMRKTMKLTAMEVARTTKFSAEDAAKSYYYLASAGLNAAQSVKALPAVAKFAQAGMFDMARATDLLTDAQSALGLTVAGAQANLRNMRHVSDVLVKANTIANASVEQFSEALTSKAGAALRIVSKDIEEGVAVLAAFADQGVKSSDAGTALNIVLRDLSTKALKNAAAFKAAGVEVYDAAGNMKNLGGIVGDIERALGGMSDAQKKATLLQLGFSDKSVIFIQSLIGMSDRIREYEAALRQAAGTTQRVADAQLTPFAKAVAKLKAAFTELGVAMTPLVEQLAETIETHVTRAVRALGILMKALTDVPKVMEISVKMLKTQFEHAYAAQKFGWLEWLAGNEPKGKRLARLTAEHEALQDQLHALMDSVAADLFELGNTAWDTGKKIADALMGPQYQSPVRVLAHDAKELKTRLRGLAGEAERMADAMRTPFERLQKTLDKIDLLRLHQLIADPVWQRFRDKAFKDYREDLKRLNKKTSMARGGWREVDPSRFTVPGLAMSANRPQVVKDPQLITTNKHLAAIVTNTKNPVAVTGP